MQTLGSDLRESVPAVQGREEGLRMSDVVEFPRLQKISRLHSRAAVRKWLQESKIVFAMGKDGAPWTTTDALNRALFGSQQLQPNLLACLKTPLVSLRSTAGTTGSTRTSGTRSRESLKGR